MQFFGVDIAHREENIFTGSSPTRLLTRDQGERTLPADYYSLSKRKIRSGNEED